MFMEVASSDDVGLVLVSDGFGRGLEAHVSLLMWHGGASKKPPSRLARKHLID